MLHSQTKTIFYTAAVVLCNFNKQESTLKRFATRIMKQKGQFYTKLAYSIVAAKIAKMAYAILMITISSIQITENQSIQLKRKIPRIFPSLIVRFYGEQKIVSKGCPL
ncbi:MAG: hypothetical protein BAJALOKI2v1_110040 [Promethearchaeota archaeon]|nr:MAG: hypothetical protein BAJALOKI2v1_110040 [Candidatus Lokiarchaeota archaeon]